MRSARVAGDDSAQVNHRHAARAHRLSERRSYHDQTMSASEEFSVRDYLVLGPLEVRRDGASLFLSYPLKRSKSNTNRSRKTKP